MMKTLSLYSLLIVMALFATSCQDDDTPSGSSGPNIDSRFTVFNYDGANRDAPQLPGNTYEAAIQFPSNQLSGVQGQSLKEVHFYIRQVPAFCEIRVYTSPGGLAPVNLLYSREITGDIQGDQWNAHVLETPVEITSDNLWIGLNFAHNGLRRTVGCDEGPARANGDWLFDSADGQWVPLSQRSAININWNIRAAVE